MHERDELAVWAHEGEVFGEALFAVLGEQAGNAASQREYEDLRALEARTAVVACGLLCRLGITPSDGTEARSRAARAHVQLTSMSRAAILDALAEGVAPAIAKYERLAELLPDHERWVADELIAHEQALAAYVDAARAGSGDPTSVVRSPMS